LKFSFPARCRSCLFFLKTSRLAFRPCISSEEVGRRKKETPILILPTGREIFPLAKKRFLTAGKLVSTVGKIFLTARKTFPLAKTFLPLGSSSAEVTRRRKNQADLKGR